MKLRVYLNFISLFLLVIPAFAQDSAPVSNVGISTLIPTPNYEVVGDMLIQKNLGVSQSVYVGKDLSVQDTARVGKALIVTGQVGIGIVPSGSDRLSVQGNAYVNGLLTTENLIVKQKLDIKGTFSVAGSLGVGIATPNATLHVNGDGQFDGTIRANKIIVQTIEVANPAQSGSLSLGDNLFVNGSVGIGTQKTDGFKLSVNGKIRASDIIKVYPEAEWADYVFLKNYRLRSLEEVDRYIQTHGHLPAIPSAKQVAKEGIDLGSMDAKLLEKIEELTLYMIELKKENQALKKQMDSLQAAKK